MSALRLLLLGPPRLEGPPGTAVPRLGDRAIALLVYLAAQPGQSAGREQVAALLWGHSGGRHALRQTLLVLRRRLGDRADVLLVDHARLRLGPGLETDLARFEADLAAGRIESACARWRGPFCDGLDGRGTGFEDWLLLERARLEERAAGAFADLVRLAVADGRHELALLAARRLVALDPLDDAAQAQLIALYRRRGWTAAARLAHRRCIGLFRRELGILPAAEVQAAARTPLPVHAAPVHASPVPAARPAAPRRWRAAAAAAVALAGAALLAADRGGLAPAPVAAAPAAAWVDADEWRPDARPDGRGLPLDEAIGRALAGDPDFAHLYPRGC